MGDDRILEALGNQYSPDILRAAAEPRSAQELSDELDVPIATCYRRLEELAEVGLLVLHDRVISEERRRTNVYRRGIEEIQITFEGRKLDVSISDRPELKDKLDNVWEQIETN